MNRSPNGKQPRLPETYAGIRVWLGCLLLVTAAAFLRFYNLGYPSAPPEQALVNLPPGLNPDEAISNMGGELVIAAGRPLPFIRLETGVGSALPTLIALVFLLLGKFSAGSRYASAFASLTAILSAGWLARELFWTAVSPVKRGVLVFTTAITIAFSYWFLHFGRLGMEHMMTPALAFPALAMGWLALRKGGWWRFLIAGLMLGLVPYAYPAAYFVPPAIALFLAIAWQAFRPPARRWLAPLGLYAGGAFVSLSPLIAFAAREPQWFLGRAAQVSDGLSFTAVWNNLTITLKALFLSGDMATRYNLPGRPLMDPLQAALFVIGLLALRARKTRLQALFLGSWLAVGLMPEILTTDNLPQFGRLATAVGPIFIIVAYGAFHLWRWSRVRRGSRQATLVLALCLASSALYSTHAYFVLWPETPGLLFTFSTAPRLQAELASQLPAEATKYLTPVDRNHNTIAFILNSRKSENVKSFNGRECLVLPAPGSQVAYYLIASLEDSHSRERLADFFPEIETIEVFLTGGSPFVEVLRIPASDTPQFRDLLERPPVVTGIARLLAWNVSPGPYHPGQDLVVTLTWESLFRPDRAGSSPGLFTRYVHLLENPTGEAGIPLRSNTDSWPCDNAYPTTSWNLGQTLVEYVKLHITADILPRRYHIETGFYDSLSGDLVPITPGQQPSGLVNPDESIYLQAIEVTSPN